MKKERILDVSFLKDEKRGVAISKEGETPAEIPIKEMRRKILENKAAADIKVSNLKFQQFLNDKRMFQESKEARSIDVEGIKVKNQQVVNEVRFASGSLLEGFLSFYGVQLDRAINNYENRLHVIEDNNKAYIGKLSRDGDVTRVSPMMEKDQASEKLNEFNRQKDYKRTQQKNMEREVQLELHQEEDKK